MKKIVLLVALCLCVGNLFAQDADKLRDEGDAALKAKDYGYRRNKIRRILETKQLPRHRSYLQLRIRR